MKRYLSYLLIVPLLVLAACGDRTDTDYTADTTTTYDHDDRHMQAELQSWLDEIDRNFEQLQTRVQTAALDEDWTSDIQDLRERRDEIRADLQRMGGQPGTQYGTTPQTGTMGDDQYTTDDRRADGVAPGTTGETADGTTMSPGTTEPRATTPGTTTPGTTGQTYADTGDYDRLRERMEELDADIEELRLRSITSRDEFIAEVDTRLNEIDRDLDAMTRRNGAATGATAPRTTTPGATAPGTADDRTMTGDDRAVTDGTRDHTMATHDDVDVESLRDDRDDVRETLADLRAGETEFDNEHENLAEQVADLRARVKSATVQTGASTTMGTTPQSAATDRDVDV
jgi:hypothetical protein